MAKSKKPVARIGGFAAREKKGPLWKFTERNDGSFIAPDPDYVTALYFPLFNLAGMKCSITPDFKGDVCTDFHSFLTIPQVTEDFHISKASRNFWIYVDGKEPWSATGTSAFKSAAHWDGKEQAFVEAGLGWFSTVRNHKGLGLAARATAFVPAADDMVEVTIIEIENESKKPVTFTATSASPLFGRGAENLRDHRQVTSMFNESKILKNGVYVKARIVHDEKGHRANEKRYATLAADQNGGAPKRIWSNEIEFIGEGGSLDNPEAVYKNNEGTPGGVGVRQGVECVAAMRFAPVTLKPGQKRSFIVIRGITEKESDFNAWLNRYGTEPKAAKALAEAKAAWNKISDALHFETADPQIDNLLRWIAFQPFCRKVYGNSYLPDHDYGRGGRGWRDLWSDLAALFLVDPADTREDIVNNLHGVRVDGTNATIIGTKPGEFVADRNNIVRTWCDHGAWPFFILNFYIDQTGDHEILFKEITYWKDAIVGRGKLRDMLWNDSYGPHQKDASNSVYKGSILEHVLLQQLSCFFNVGEHNNLLLEGADWNDTYDMGRDRGESVCFYNWVAWNLKLIAGICGELEAKGKTSVSLLSEISILLDRLPGQKPVDYENPVAKKKRLHEYFESIKHQVSGKKIEIACKALADDLRQKAEFIYEHIRKNEYLQTKDGERFFNGHYDNDAVRVHGDHPNGVRIDLTSQVLPIMCGTATDDQIKEVYRSLISYLRNPKTGGLRLSTDLKELKLNFGRVSGFAYGWRENGSIWSQQNAMLIYGLYSRGFVKEGYAVYKELIGLCTNSGQSRVFPNLPSCFRLDGKGISSYLTGSATWLILAMVTQMFGVRGERGNLAVEPKLMKEQFGARGIALHCNFLGKDLTVRFKNPKRLEWPDYSIVAATMNGKPLDNFGGKKKLLINQRDFEGRAKAGTNEIEVELG